MIKHVCFLKKVKDRYACRSGFLQEVAIFCRNNKIPVTKITDERTKFPHQSKEWSYDELRSFYDPSFPYVEHQIQALKTLLKVNTGIVKIITGGGKTEIIIALMKATGLPTLILVNKITLANQTQQRIMKSGIDCGIATGSGIKLEYNMVATIGSVKKIPDLHKYKMLVVDELHNASSKQFQVFFEATSYPLRFGFSATPEGNDKYKYSKIRHHFGSVVAETTAKELMENDVITRPIIKFMEVECEPTIDWPSANNKCIMYNKKRNKIICDIIEKYKEPTLVLVKNIEHGEALRDAIPGSVFLSGIDDNRERIDIIEKFENREVSCIIATSILNEGISINVIRVLIIASGGKSSIQSSQRLGRSLRKDKGKMVAFVYDFKDLNNKYCYRHSVIRRDTYQKAGFEVIW